MSNTLTSSSSSTPCQVIADDKQISSVANLEPNTLYCDSQSILDTIAVDECCNILSQQKCCIKIVPHCLSFRLLHIFGPFQNDSLLTQNVVLLASCVHDDSHNVLISVIQNGQLEREISLEYINRTFTITNLLTLHLNQVNFGSSHLNCHLLAKPLRPIVIVLSDQYKSILNFFGDNLGNALSSDDQEMECHSSDSSYISDISLNDLQQDVLAGQEQLLTDDETNQTTSSVNTSSTTTTNNTIDDGGRTNRLLVNGSSLASSTTGQVDSVERHHEIVAAENNVTNGVNCTGTSHHSEAQSCELNQSQLAKATCTQNGQEPLEQSVELNDSLRQVYDELNANCKQHYSVEHFFRVNMSLVTGSERTVEKLANVPFPSNSVQNCNFTNVVGLVKSVCMNKNRRLELSIYDEETPSFVVLLGYHETDSVQSQDFRQDEVDRFLFGSNCASHYEQLKPSLIVGHLVCIRDLCLTAKEAICTHTNQLTIMEPYKKGDKLNVLHGKSELCRSEFKRVVELVCLAASELTTNAKPTKSLTYMILNCTGQVLAKRITPKRAEVFVLLPYKNTTPSFIAENALNLINEQIENMAFSERRLVFTKQILQNLIQENYVIYLSAYENHVNVLNSLIPLDLVAFFNVHVKLDRLYSGYSQYILHGGSDFGRRCFFVESNSILGERILNSIDTILKNASTDSALNSILYHFETNIDETIASRLIENNNISEVAKKFIEKEAAALEEATALATKSINATLNVILKSYINIEIAQQIYSFEEIVRNPEIRFFRISASMVDYHFEDKDGLVIQNMAALRRNFINIVCTSVKCNYACTFSSIITQVACSIANHNQKLTCPKCLSTLVPCLTIQLNLQDNDQVQLSVLISSPEVEDLIGSTSNQLIYSDPLSTDICDSLHYILKTYCPHRLLEDDNFLQTKKRRKIPEQINSQNPELEWLIQSVKLDLNKVNCQNYPNQLNMHLFPKQGGQSHVFYVRGILDCQNPHCDLLLSLNL